MASKKKKKKFTRNARQKARRKELDRFRAKKMKTIAKHVSGRTRVTLDVLSGTNAELKSCKK